MDLIVDPELLSDCLQDIRRADHPANRGHADPDHVSAAGPDLVQLLGVNGVVPGMLLGLMESREKPVAWFQEPSMERPGGPVKEFASAG